VLRYCKLAVVVPLWRLAHQVTSVEVLRGRALVRARQIYSGKSSRETGQGRRLWGDVVDLFLSLCVCRCSPKSHS
jgi:hypothetical protein